VRRIDPDLQYDVYAYLRMYKQEVLKEPNYLLAQRIDDVCGELLLKQSQTFYSETKSIEVDRLEDRLERARERLQEVRENIASSKQDFEDRKREALSRLEQEQKYELADHDEVYSQDLPPRLRHVPGEILQIREQERFLRQSRRYIEAQELREESQALEAYHMELRKIQWRQEGETWRQVLKKKHQQQRLCLLAKWDRTRQTKDIELREHEKHLMSVVSNLDRLYRREQADRREVELKTRQLLKRPPGGPKLGRVLPRSAMRRVTTVNTRNDFAYHLGPPKPRTSFR
jgi:hypothetical protein